AAALAGEELRGARGEVAALDERLRAADAELAPVRAPELQVASFHGDRAGRARVLLDPGSRRWIVVAFELPALDDKDYQLWLVPDGGAPVSAGLLRRRPDGVLEVAGTVPSSIASFRPAISLEPRGGSAAPTAIQMVGEPL
ncbi:MAG TPA: anti-sigma factor, partial [Kofleriaceae bacterium]|nr:anti-sigma factor [Kofleriaceae bacterium]